MQLKKELVEICHKIHSKGFVSATDGNVSVRIKKDRIICTPTSVPKEKITEKDLITLNLDGKIISGSRKPSTEIKMHLAIYKERKDVNAVVHAHPIFATAFASSKLALDIPFLPEVILNLGLVPVCEYSTPSTEEVVKSIMPFIQKTNLLLLQNHGAVTYGKNLEEAYYLLEKLEHTAKVFSIAMQLNGVRPLTKKQLKYLYQVNENTYKINQDFKIKFKNQRRKN
ncbi:MAG: class II aldolase/adducin family protein [Ignavibacteria bacterium]|nr:class II aldolase/adducin family protein [Ignavibacteria bacterium]MDH7528907.1 class II aldolase/adducin family protein [Ignavibacteria bacterium]